MKELPIIFSTEMVKALLDGRKTQTRRIVRPQPEKCEKVAIDCASPSGYSLIADAYEDTHLKHWYGKPGDLLYVREAWRYAGGGFEGRVDQSVMGVEAFVYRADEEWNGPWRPSIHLPKNGSRIWLKVANIKAERLQTISEEDAIAEGVWLDKTVTPNGYTVFGMPHWFTAKEAFASLWMGINGAESWELNPWVWVISFEVVSTTGLKAVSNLTAEVAKQ